jgi:hypothetical protein
MSRCASSALAVVCSLLLVSSVADAFEAGVEVGGMDTSSNGATSATPSTSAGSATFGVILVQPFHLIPLLQISTWEDFQTPFNVQTGSTSTAQYWAVDVGARLGLDLGLLVPYAGIVGQLLILSSSPSDQSLNSTAWGLGGDIGLDLSIVILKIGLELRYLETLSPIATNTTTQSYPSSVGEFEVLGSVRLSF